MASFVKIHSFVENLAEGTINLGGDALKVALTNTAHTATWDELADLTLATGTPANINIAITTSTSAQTTGTYKLVCADLVMTATDAVGPFRYVYIYSDTSTGDKLIGYYDYGSAISLATGDTLTIDFDGSNGVLTIA